MVYTLMETDMGLYGLYEHEKEDQYYHVGITQGGK